MKIAYYTDQLYKYGGIEQVIANKLKYLSRNTDHELYLLTFEQKNQKLRYPISDEIIREDLNVSYDRSKSYFHPKNLFQAPRHYLRLKKWINKIKPDVLVVCHYSFDFYFLPIIGKKYKTMLIKEFHSSRHYQHQQQMITTNVFRKLVYRINRYIEAKYDFLVVLTEDERKYFSSDNLVVIPNAISKIPEKVAKLENKKVITAGRVAPVKGYDQLINAWAIVHQSYPEWSLDIFGDGDKAYMSSIKDRIIELGLEGSVFVRGSTGNMIGEMMEASLYVMSSKTECFPMVLLESLSCGLPVVSFNCPNGPRNIIRHNEDGLLVPDQNVQELARHMKMLISDGSYRVQLGQMGRKNVQRFSPKSVMEKWNALFDLASAPSS